jgi:hypothetical protein
MAFTDALYYPWIDINDEAWLKSAVLYWDTIHTIVPFSVTSPYSNNTARELQASDVLIPFRIDSAMHEVASLTDAVLDYLETPEGMQVLVSENVSGYQYLHPSKMPYEIREILNLSGRDVVRILDRQTESVASRTRPEPWLRVDDRFAHFYMTLLAKQIADRTGLGLLTDTASYDNLCNVVRLDARFGVGFRHRGSDPFDAHSRNIPNELAQGLFINLVMERIQIDPQTPVNELLEFRQDHAIELRQFRAAVSNLVSNVTAITYDAFIHRINDVYENQFLPSMYTIKHQLTNQGIRWFSDNWLKVAFFGATPASLPIALLGVSVPQALLVGAGISITAALALFNTQKRDVLMNNPYSYVMAVSRRFPR